MHDYITNITLAKGSGEYCISHILGFGAHAHLPLVDRVYALRKGMPVTFMYGDHDWMDPRGGKESVDRMKAAGNPNGKLKIIQDAGHHRKYPLLPVSKFPLTLVVLLVYLDNAEQTNRLLMEELDR